MNNWPKHIKQLKNCLDCIHSTYEAPEDFLQKREKEVGYPVTECLLHNFDFDEYEEVTGNIGICSICDDFEEEQRLFADKTPEEVAEFLESLKNFKLKHPISYYLEKVKNGN